MIDTTDLMGDRRKLHCIVLGECGNINIIVCPVQKRLKQVKRCSNVYTTLYPPSLEALRNATTWAFWKACTFKIRSAKSIVARRIPSPLRNGEKMSSWGYPCMVEKTTWTCTAGEAKTQCSRCLLESERCETKIKEHAHTHHWNGADFMTFLEKCWPTISRPKNASVV